MAWQVPRGVALVAATLFSACGVVNTVPKTVSPEDPVVRYDLVVPNDLDVRSADFSATMFAAASGSGGATYSDVGGRAFIKLYAVHRETGEQYLLVYENIAKRKEPIMVIRLLPRS